MKFASRETLIVAVTVAASLSLALGSNYLSSASNQQARQWLAGDHHIHSRFSVGWDNSTNPPTPVLAGDAIYPIPMNAVMGRKHGLDWMVATDHGGPNHAQLNRDYAYKELLESRLAVPDVVQFFGMEFDTPGADHSSVIIPYSDHEADDLFSVESRFSKRQPWPADASWDTEPRMLEALEYMREMARLPIVIAHHPSRSAADLRDYGSTSATELRQWNDVAPQVAIGMEGSPGHQAAVLRQPPLGIANAGMEANPPASTGSRGSYRRYPTMGGYDQMTAELGGFWDSMLAEGRHWWITANSDSHVHWRDGGSDFWPGEYSKTYILAEKNHHSILESFRQGRIFVTTGDLISELWFTVSATDKQTDTGGTLTVSRGADLNISIRFLDPDANNFNGKNPSVQRVDLIVGQITGKVVDPATSTTASTNVEARFSDSDWRTDGNYRVIDYTLSDVQAPLYLRVRGTNTTELEPEPDPAGENPWDDLWFYSNPIFVQVE
ncbi:MAG: phosphoesterase [Pseudohongiella sp.]|nr:phosphoesterase [Pseudohongiella sp.]MDO9519434.1 phosphoesterase [Pseudohongiella sp.]